MQNTIGNQDIVSALKTKFLIYRKHHITVHADLSTSVCKQYYFYFLNLHIKTVISTFGDIVQDSNVCPESQPDSKSDELFFFLTILQYSHTSYCLLFQRNLLFCSTCNISFKINHGGRNANQKQVNSAWHKTLPWWIKISLLLPYLQSSYWNTICILPLQHI